MGELAVAEITTAMVHAAFGKTAAQARAKDDDPFLAGEYVVYPTHGVGKVDRMVSRKSAATGST